MHDLRTRPAVLSRSEADRWDAWEACKSQVPSQAEIDYLAMLARTDPQELERLRPNSEELASRGVKLTPNEFAKFLEGHVGKTLTVRELADLSGCSYGRVHNAVRKLTSKGIIRRVGKRFKILPREAEANL